MKFIVLISYTDGERWWSVFPTLEAAQKYAKFSKTYVDKITILESAKEFCL